MEHSFNVNFAMEHGLAAAILYRNFQFWISKNLADGRNFHEDRTWTFNSMRALADLFPYLTFSEVRAALITLTDKGILIRGRFNKKKYDRTTWYAFVDEQIALQGLPAHLWDAQMGKRAKNAICATHKCNCATRKCTCATRKPIPDTQPIPLNPDKNCIEEISPDEILDLDCRIAEKLKIFEQHLKKAWHFTPGSMSTNTFANIISHLVKIVQKEPDRIGVFEEAVQWISEAKAKGRKAGGKALFVSMIQEHTGFESKQLLPSRFSDKRKEETL